MCSCDSCISSQRLERLHREMGEILTAMYSLRRACRSIAASIDRTGGDGADHSQTVRRSLLGVASALDQVFEAEQIQQDAILPT